MDRNELNINTSKELERNYKDKVDSRIHEKSLTQINTSNNSFNSNCAKLNMKLDSNLHNKLISSNKKLFSGATLVAKKEFPKNSCESKFKNPSNNSNCSVLWMYKSERGWMPFTENNNIYIESKYKNKTKTVVIYPYQLDFTNFVQTNLLTGTERRILRCDKNSFPLINNKKSQELVIIDPLMNLISLNTSKFLNNILNLLNFDNHYLANNLTSTQKNYRTEPAKNQSGGNGNSKQLIIPRLQIENCKGNLLLDSTINTVSHTNSLSTTPTGGYMTRSSTRFEHNVKNKCKCSTDTCSRVVQSDVASTSVDVSDNDIRDSRIDRSERSKFSEIQADEEIKIPKIYFHNILGNNIPQKGAKLSADLSSSSSSVSNDIVGVLSENNKDETGKTSNKSSCGSKSLFFFTPHKYRKSMGIIVPRILSCRFNSKKSTKNSEEKVNNKNVRFNCGLMSPDHSKRSLGGYISTPRRVNPNISKESLSNQSCESSPLKEFSESKIPESPILSGNLQNLPSPRNKETKYIQNDNPQAFSVKSAFIVLNEDSIPLDFSYNSKPISIFDGNGAGNKNEGTGSYLDTLNSWSRIGRMQSDLFETMSENEFSTKRISLNLNDFEDEEVVSDTDARFLLDEDSRKLISLGNFDSNKGSPRPINWWFNHSVRHITVKLNCENSNFKKKLAPIEIIPLLKPLLTGYINENIPIVSKILPQVQISGTSSHVLLGLKSLEILGLKPNKSEFPKISEFCFTELNNIIPISLEELYIVQSIIPISIFSLLLTRFPVPAASTFSFSLICNDDELPNTGLQTIQVINLHLSQNPCSHIKRRNRYGKSKGRRHLAYSGDSTCCHVHLDIFRKYNHVKICPWLAISNFVDEFVLRTPILVKCIIDPHNIMVVPSINSKNLRENSRSLYDYRDSQNNNGINNIGDLSRGAEFVIMTANLILPLLIIQSHSIQNIIIGGEIEDQSDSLSKNVTKLRVDSIVFTCKYLPFKFFKVRNLDLFLDLNIDKSELGLFIRNNCFKDETKSLSSTQLLEEKDQIRDQDYDNYCLQQLYDSINSWIDEFSAWLDKYVCCDSIEILRVNLYATSRFLELKINNSINNNNNIYKDNINNAYYGICDKTNSQEFKRFYHEQSNPKSEYINSNNVLNREPEGKANTIDHDISSFRNILNFDPLCQKFLSKSKASHSSLNDVKIKICISSHLQNFIFGAKKFCE